MIGSITSGCGSTEGCITLNGYGSLNDADGLLGGVGSSSNTGEGSISGITAPGAGYLVGLFVDTDGPAGTAPPALDYTSTSSTSSSSYSPLVDQTFFIGDGLTGSVRVRNRFSMSRLAQRNCTWGSAMRPATTAAPALTVTITALSQQPTTCRGVHPPALPSLARFCCSEPA